MNRLKKPIRQLREKSMQFLESVPIQFENRFGHYPEKELIIFDTMFPHLVSGFRIAEFNAYLSEFDAEVHSTGKGFSPITGSNQFPEALAEYKKIYPQLANRVVKFHPLRFLSAKVMYTVFLGNAYNFIPYAERIETPFLFTLYPGGGFRLHDINTDERLRRIFNSKSFQKVIVTQKITRDYLISSDLCSDEQIEFIYGSVLPVQYLKEMQLPKKHFGQEKNTFDICFVAAKYMVMGKDKGYDVFVEIAKKIIKHKKNVNFHVVGNFDSTDIDLEDAKNNFSFYGIRYTNFFPEFYSNMDIILSPNIPFILARGAFDGFPTGACVEAGLSGVAIFCTDTLNQNMFFQNNKDIVIIPKNTNQIVDIIMSFLKDPSLIYSLAASGQLTIEKIFGFHSQMYPRINLLSKYIEVTV